MFRRAAISFRADATSSPCARLSSWHGPAMIEIGNWLPNLTRPTSTISAAEVAALKDMFLFGATMQGTHAPINLILFEYQGCAECLIRRHDQPLSQASF